MNRVFRRTRFGDALLCWKTARGCGATTTEQGRTDGKLGGAEPDQHVFVLTLPAEPVSKLTKTKRLAVLHPGTQAARIPVQRGPVGATGK